LKTKAKETLQWSGVFGVEKKWNYEKHFPFIKKTVLRILFFLFLFIALFGHWLFSAIVFFIFIFFSFSAWLSLAYKHISQDKLEKQVGIRD
jgi:hypothetical protein